MTVKQLIKHLKTFDKGHSVEMKIKTEYGYLLVGSTIQDVQFEDGKCILRGTESQYRKSRVRLSFGW